MSFAAVLALIAGHEAARPWLLIAASHGGWGRRLALKVGGTLFTSLLAGAATAPFGAYHFGRAQSWFMLANLLAVPLTGLWIMPFGLLALALMPLGLDWLALAPMGWGMAALLALARAVAALPAATTDIPFMPAWGLGAFALGLVWLCLWRSPLRLLGVAGIVAGVASPLLVRPADILVSADARVVALWTAAGVHAHSTQGNAPFTLENWSRYWAAPVRGTKLPDNMPDAIACDGPACRLGPRGDVLLLRQGGAVPAAACGGISLVIAVEPLHESCPGAARIDRFTAWREGAHAIWIDPGGVHVLSDRAFRGERPWVELPPRRRPDLPAARDE
jgi:competence protein ComEC